MYKNVTAGCQKMASQLSDWQIVQSRVYFCDFGRKLVNLSLPVHV